MYYFDMIQYLEGQKDKKVRYDVLNFISSLQGVINREAPRLYTYFIKESDDYWLRYLQQEWSWFKEQDINVLKDLNDIIDRFKDYIPGVILWDEEVPSTSNVAATICGVEGLIPLRHDEAPHSLYHQIVLEGPRLEVKKSLVGMFTGQGEIPDINIPSTGSKKCDAYIWAKEQYLDRKKCNDKLMAYMVDAYIDPDREDWYEDLDNQMLTNHDYYIANKAFFFDLSPWADETPNDDREQPLGTDLCTMKKILLSQYHQNKGKKITSIGGFTPWHIKYVDHKNDHCKHEGVPTEWEYGEIVSAYNAIMDADAPRLCGLANASVFQYFPLKTQYRQAHKDKPVVLEDKTYILYYMGDYDSAAWMNRCIPSIWDDPNRGKVPIMWPFNPNLSDRVPQVFEYIYKTKTDNDHFAGGDSGAGYLNPTFLVEPRKHSELPTALDVWIAYNEYYYRKFDLSVTGFIINGYDTITEEVQKAYSHFSPEGVGHNGKVPVKIIVNDTVFWPHTADIALLDRDMEQAAQTIYEHTKAEGPQFCIFRAVLCTPTYIYNLTEKIKKEYPENNYEVVDPYTFFELIRKYNSLTSNDKVKGLK